MMCEHLVPGHVTHGRVANPGHECERVLCWPTLIKQIGLALNIQGAKSDLYVHEHRLTSS